MSLLSGSRFQNAPVGHLQHSGHPGLTTAKLTPTGWTKYIWIQGEQESFVLGKAGRQGQAGVARPPAQDFTR